MKRFAILLAGLTAAVPANAQTTLQSRTVPAPVRYGYVYYQAQQTCPAAEAHRFREPTKLAFVDNAATKASMTEDERSLLFAMCDMYKRGRSAS